MVRFFVISTAFVLLIVAACAGNDCSVDVSGNTEANQEPVISLVKLMSWTFTDFEENLGAPARCYGSMDRGKTCFYQKLEPYYLAYDNCGVATPVDDYRYHVSFVKEKVVSIIIRDLQLPFSKGGMKSLGLRDIKTDYLTYDSYDSYDGAAIMTWGNREGFEMISFASCKNSTTLESVRAITSRENVISEHPVFVQYSNCDELISKVGQVPGICFNSASDIQDCRTIVVE